MARPAILPINQLTTATGPATLQKHSSEVCRHSGVKQVDGKGGNTPPPTHTHTHWASQGVLHGKYPVIN